MTHGSPFIFCWLAKHSGKKTRSIREEETIQEMNSNHIHICWKVKVTRLLGSFVLHLTEARWIPNFLENFMLKAY